MEDDDVKLIWEINIQYDDVIEARRPDLFLVDKKKKSCVIIDVAIPGDCRICEKEIEKIKKYQNLKRELKSFWSLKKVEVVPVVVGALECISKGFLMDGRTWYKTECQNCTKISLVGNSKDTQESLRHVR